MVDNVDHFQDHRSKQGNREIWGQTKDIPEYAGWADNGQRPGFSGQEDQIVMGTEKGLQWANLTGHQLRGPLNWVLLDDGRSSQTPSDPYMLYNEQYAISER